MSLRDHASEGTSQFRGLIEMAGHGVAGCDLLDHRDLLGTARRSARAACVKATSGWRRKRAWNLAGKRKSFVFVVWMRWQSGSEQRLCVRMQWTFAELTAVG